MIDRRPKIVIYGACQSHFLAEVLKGVPALAARFRFIEVLNYAPPLQSIPDIPDDIWDAELLWEQFDKRESVPRRDEVRQRAGSSTLRINFPMMTAFSPWPFIWPEPRTRPEPEFPFGRYPWGDRIALKVAQMGLLGDDSYRKYMELSEASMPDLLKLFDEDRLAAARRDECCEVKLGDLIYDNILSDHLFWAWGHIASTLIVALAIRLCRTSKEVVGPLSVGLIDELKRAAALCPGQGTEQLPIDPRVGAELKLQYCRSDRRYNWFGNKWTFEEYLKRYIAFDRSWPLKEA